MITIASFTYPTDAYMLKGRLEAEGIPCFLADEQTVSVHPFYSHAIGGVKLQVPRRYYTEALLLIKELEESAHEGEERFSYTDIVKQYEILRIKALLREMDTLLDETPESIKTKFPSLPLNDPEYNELIKTEKHYRGIRENIPLRRSFLQLIRDLVMGRSYQSKLPPDYYIEQELIDEMKRNGEER